MLISYVFQFALLRFSYGAIFDTPHPLKIAELGLGQIMKIGIPAVVDKGTANFLGKLHNGVFDMQKGFVDGLNEVVGTPVDLEQLTFYLVTNKNLEAPSKIDFFKPYDVARTKGKIIFLIHGWKASMNTSWYHDLAEIFIKKNPDTHVVEVNWNGPASENYAFSAFATESAGNYVGILINRLVMNYRVPIKNILLIGHSLGAQISGWAAKKFIEITGKKLARIVALDPAGPLFVLRPDSRRLNKKDADVVSVVHTDADKLGFPLVTGTIDFFPNGGGNQPGCWSVDLAKVSTYLEPVTCDHSRAWDFFVEAVNNTGSFLARKCENAWYKKDDDCVDVFVAMGDLETRAKGTFYLETNSERPYSKPYSLMEKKSATNTNVNTTQKIENLTEVPSKNILIPPMPEKSDTNTNVNTTQKNENVTEVPSKNTPLPPMPKKSDTNTNVNTTQINENVTEVPSKNTPLPPMPKKSDTNTNVNTTQKIENVTEVPSKNTPLLPMEKKSDTSTNVNTTQKIQNMTEVPS